MTPRVHLDLSPLKPSDVPPAGSPEFSAWLDEHFQAADKVIESIDRWSKGPVKANGAVQIMNLDRSCGAIKGELGVEEYWCARRSAHSSETVARYAGSSGPTAAAQGTVSPNLYSQFRSGLFENHSENEHQYIEACHEIQRLQVLEPQVAEVWRLTYKTPPPTKPRTFVVLLLSRELFTEPAGRRSFINVSLPFDHPDCREKSGAEKSRVRGRYVSVEKVHETDGGKQVEWRMATSSDAGGNIPRFMTNSSLPSQIAVDVPSFLKWMVKRSSRPADGLTPASDQ